MQTGAHKTGSAQRGFTLLEVLVSFVLFSLIMLGMTQTLRGVGDTESRVMARQQQTEDLRIVHQFLGQIFQGVVMLSVADPQQTQGRRHFVEVEPGHIAWIGHLPARPGFGGRYFLRLAVEPEPNEPANRSLVLRYQPWAADATHWPDWAQTESRVLFKSVPEVVFQAKLHQVPASEPALQGHDNWVDRWPPVRYLPDAIRIQPVAANEPAAPALPPFTVAVRPTSASDPSIVRFTVGGRS